MKKFYYLALVALVGIAFSSCSLMGGDKAPSYQLSDLQGYWLENNTEHYVRFTTEQSDENPYLYGYEWDEADEMTEELLWSEREAIGHPGDGWFKYWFESKGDLHEIHLMNNEGAEIPKEYIVSKLTSTSLEYYEKDNKSKKSSFSKVVEKK